MLCNTYHYVYSILLVCDVLGKEFDRLFAFVKVYIYFISQIVLYLIFVRNTFYEIYHIFYCIFYFYF